tara:strand:+ start:300 stop:494 length:195 start_codon:yes stop_codon:yes gene_type:complete
MFALFPRHRAAIPCSLTILERVPKVDPVGLDVEVVFIMFLTWDKVLTLSNGAKAVLARIMEVEY